MYHWTFLDSNGIKSNDWIAINYFKFSFHRIERKYEEKKVTGEAENFWSGFPG